MTSQPNVVEIPRNVKTMPCGKCGREILVGKNTVLAFCRDCSANLGVKK
jgi:RNase P subunit RPR2